MQIDFSTTPPAGTSTTPAKSQSTIDYESFLTLLVAEMKNQDPTAPMDSTDFVAQLATFSSVEQSVQMNSKLDQMLQSSALAQADSLIGRTVTSADGATTGVVEEVRLLSDGMIAVLDDGTEVKVEAGMVIKDTPQ